MKEISPPTVDNTNYLSYDYYRALESNFYDVPDSWSLHTQFQWRDKREASFVTKIHPKVRDLFSAFAKDGFYYTRNKDHIKCGFCGVVFGDFTDDDYEDQWHRITRAHAKSAPNCPRNMRPEQLTYNPEKVTMSPAYLTTLKKRKEEEEEESRSGIAKAIVHGEQPKEDGSRQRKSRCTAV